VILLPVLSECFHSLAVGCAQFSFTMDMEVDRMIRRLEGVAISEDLIYIFCRNPMLDIYLRGLLHEFNMFNLFH